MDLSRPSSTPVYGNFSVKNPVGFVPNPMLTTIYGQGEVATKIGKTALSNCKIFCSPRATLTVGVFLKHDKSFSIVNKGSFKYVVLSFNSSLAFS